VCDIVYVPLETPLVQAARRAGCAAGLRVRLQDFSAFNRGRYGLRLPRAPRPPPVVLDAAGLPLAAERPRPRPAWKSWRDRFLPGIRRAGRRRGFLRHAAGLAAERAEVLGLILEKPADAG